MAGKNVEGQLELFSLFDSVEELEQKIKGAGLKEVQGEPVMEQCYRHRDTGETAVAAYLDYNRVYVADWGRKPLLYQFDSTKEAVELIQQGLPAPGLCGGLGQEAPAVSV